MRRTYTDESRRKARERNLKKTPLQKERRKQYERAYRDKNRSRLATYNRARYQTRLEIEHHEAKQWRANNVITIMLAKAKTRAKRAGVPFSLEEKHIIIPSHCPVLGILLARSSGYREDSSPSLDRVIPERGYTPATVRVISNRANCIKRDGTAKEHRLIADYIDTETAIADLI